MLIHCLFFVFLSGDVSIIQILVRDSTNYTQSSNLLCDLRPVRPRRVPSFFP
jgi:hypothetical protein